MRLKANMKTSLMIMYIAMIVSKSGDAFLPGIENQRCTDADPIPPNSIQLSYTTLKEANGNWILLYNISWVPPSQYEYVVYLTDLQLETTRTSLTPWVFQSCKEALQAASASAKDKLSQSATISREAPFTHNALFQLAYGVTSEGSPLPVSSVSQKEFETPDCYMETRDANFCAAQSVVRCGMPIHVLLVRVEYSSENNIVMMFSWCPPIQVNQIRSLSRYKVQLHTIDGDLLLTDSIQHESDNETYYWIATSPDIQEGNQYKLTIVPYLSDTYGDEPGRLFTQSFAAMIFKEETTVDPEGAVTSTVSLNRNNAPVRSKDPPPGQPPNLHPHSPTASFPTTVIAVVLLVGLAVVVVIICTVCILWTRTRRRETNDRLENLHLEQMYQEKAIEKTREIDPILKDKEISHDQVIIEHKLGEGEFGLVHIGKVTGMKNKVDDVVVAIKTTKVGAFDDVKEDLLNEMKLIAELGDHVNILCLLACCSMNEPFYLITEYMKYGDLLGFLRECRRTENSEKDQIYSVQEKQQFISCS
ncbi:uncharacterized protein [Apostichopus japonicus]|uniref:uncharacterized protein n=1 Tax=Stichopus japonicus TaxID=307972 RepID=UPI003AB18389